jgi:metal-responsive CopG/Arc/MetJ family transcriptional regulator
MVSSRMPDTVVAAVDAWATQNDTTRSDAIRQLVEIGLKAKQK